MNIIVEGTQFDRVAWNPEPCKAGKMFYKLEDIKKVNIRDKKEITLRSPCRVDVGLIDFSPIQFTNSENFAKAGEMSFAGDQYTTVTVKLIDKSEIVVDSNRPMIVEHNALLMKQSTDYEGGFEIKTEDHGHKHIGLGSSSIMSETVMDAINRVLGEPLTFEEMKRLMGRNFLEEADSDKKMMFPGCTTTGSWNTIRNGGFTINSDTEMVFHADVPEEIRFVFGIPKIEVKGPEESDTDVRTYSWLRHNDRINAAKVCYWVVTEIMPTIVRGDWKAAGQTFYNYTLTGCKALLMTFYQCGLADVVFQLKATGVDGAFMSSAGPNVVAFCLSDESVQKAKDIFEKKDFRVVVIKPDNKGTIEVKR